MRPFPGPSPWSRHSRPCLSMTTGTRGPLSCFWSAPPSISVCRTSSTISCQTYWPGDFPRQRQMACRHANHYNVSGRDAMSWVAFQVAVVLSAVSFCIAVHGWKNAFWAVWGVWLKYLKSPLEKKLKWHRIASLVSSAYNTTMVPPYIKLQGWLWQMRQIRGSCKGVPVNKREFLVPGSSCDKLQRVWVESCARSLLGSSWILLTAPKGVSKAGFPLHGWSDPVPLSPSEGAQLGSVLKFCSPF